MESLGKITRISNTKNRAQKRGFLFYNEKAVNNHQGVCMKKIVFTLASALVCCAVAQAAPCNCTKGDLACVKACTHAKVKNTKEQVTAEKQQGKAFLKTDKTLTKQEKKLIREEYKSDKAAVKEEIKAAKKQAKADIKQEKAQGKAEKKAIKAEHKKAKQAAKAAKKSAQDQADVEMVEWAAVVEE